MFLEQSSTIHVDFVQLAEFEWLPWQHKGYIFSSEAIREMELKLGIHVHDISLYINCVFIVVAHVLSLLWQLKFSIDL